VIAISASECLAWVIARLPAQLVKIIPAAARRHHLLSKQRLTSHDNLAEINNSACLSPRRAA
jgi:hypothetical protein